MPVVPRRGAEEFRLRQALPRGLAAGAEEETAHHGVVHQIQTRVAADEEVGFGQTEEFGKEFLGLRDAVEAAVVAGVDAGKGMVVGEVVMQQFGGEVELIRRRFAARHIQFEPQPPTAVVGRLTFGEQRSPLGR